MNLTMAERFRTFNRYPDSTTRFATMRSGFTDSRCPTATSSYRKWKYSYYQNICMYSSVSAAMRIWAKWWVQFIEGVKDFSLLHRVQTSSEVHQPSTLWVLGALSPKVKQQGHYIDHSPPSSAKVKNGGAIPPLPQMPSWHCCIYKAR
jgi:hypothetical protein